MHVAIIMDGNGRWALRRRLARTVGHRAGARAVDRVVEAAVSRGIGTLTLYAFSADNWNRPVTEVAALMRLFRRYLFTQTRRCLEQSVRIHIIGSRQRLDPALLRAIESSERATQHCGGLQLRIAVDYSSQRSLMAVAEQLAGQTHCSDSSTRRESFTRALARADNAAGAATEVDLLIRTGGERRLSDFLLWESAYAELHFVDCLWPDFDEQAFDCALDQFARRERRFGRISAVAAVAPAAGGRRV